MSFDVCRNPRFMEIQKGQKGDSMRHMGCRWPEILCDNVTKKGTMEAALPGLSREDITRVLKAYLETRLVEPDWPVWGGTPDIAERIARFWRDEASNARDEMHAVLRRAVLAAAVPELPDKVKLEMLFKMAYPLPATPYEMGADAYLSILKQHHASKSPPRCTKGEMERIDRVFRTGYHLTMTLVVGLAVVMTVNTLMRDTKTIRYDMTASDLEKSERQQRRGAIGSIMVSGFFGTLNYLVDHYGEINPATSTALVGMCFGGTLGFLMDNTIGSDTGFRILSEQGKLHAWKYALGMLTTGAYVRYTLTVILDLFISLILFKPLFIFTSNLPYFRCGNAALANGIVATVIGIITFQAYANKTRFDWAYPTTSAETDKTWIKSGTMQIAVSVASVLFLISNTQVNPGEPGVNDPNMKLVLVIGALCLMWALTQYHEMEPVLDIDVSPRNIFNVAAAKTHLPGDIIDGSELVDIPTRKPLSGTFVIEHIGETIGDEHRYRVLRQTPAFQYERRETKSLDEVVDRAPLGSLGLIGLGAVAFGATILGTSTKTRRVKVQLFLAFMILTVALGLPGFLPTTRLRR